MWYGKLGAVVLFCLFSCFSCRLLAQHPYVFRHIDANTGLSDNLIKGIGSTPDGRISIRTQSLLNLYNGGTFDNFRQGSGTRYAWECTGDEQEYIDLQNRIWLKQESRLQVFDLKTNQFIADVGGLLASFGVQKKLEDFFIDDAKNLWFLTEDHGLSYYDVARQDLITLPGNSVAEINKFGIPREIQQVGDTCWIVYSKGLIQLWRYSTKEIIRQDTRLLGVIDEASHNLVLRASPTEGLWLMHQTDVMFYHPSSDVWTRASHISGLSNFFTCMDVDHDGNAWVGTSQSEIRVIDGADFDVQSFVGMPLTTGGILVNDISSIYVDDDNGVWIGTLFQGICYYHASMLKINLVHTVPHESHMTNENVRCFLEEADGTILVGTVNGLSRYFPQARRVEGVYPELNGKLCMGLYRDSQGRIWVPTFLNGIFCIENGKIRQYERPGVSIYADPNPNNGRTMIEDASGQLWVSVYGGVGRFDPATGNIDFLYKTHPEIKHLKLGLTFTRMDGHTLAVAAEELFFYNTKTDSLWFPAYRDQIQTYGAEFNFIFPDSRSLHWLSVDGLKVWDNGGGHLYEVPINEDRPNQTVSAILEDSMGNLWVSTMNGISKVEVKRGEEGYDFTVTNFGRMDGAGVQAGRFNTGAAMRASDSSMYFGGVHGMNVFHPERMMYNTSKHKPIFTGFRLFNTPIKERALHNGRILLEQPISQANEIHLRYHENFITLEFAGLNYVNPSKTYYRYQLENYDQGWTEIQADGVGRVNYTGLPPGKYTFKVYSANNDKFWGDEYVELAIVISPPFWATTWAKLLYSVLFVIALVSIIQYFNRLNHRKLVRQQAAEAQRQREELDQMKMSFFTNISHEFRTPLSLIMTPLELLRNEVDDSQLKEKLTSIYGHSNDLLTMVNQLLDFRKLEVKGEELRLGHGDIVEFLAGMHASFKPVANSKQLDFTFDGPDTPIYMFFDKDKVLKVMNNLLSNAFKFTDDGGTVALRVTTETVYARKYVRITVADTGYGIAETDLPYIFDRFRQANNQLANQTGSGIGLYLVNEYVALHEGKVEVESSVGEGATFTVRLPTDLEAEPIDHALLADDVQSTTEPSPTSMGKKILIVEDNAEFRHFLKSQLAKRYVVIEAPDGEEGEKRALADEPDLILSDMMMPKIDGITLCHRLKSNIQTSHIPIILLTARMSDDARMSVYSAGADSYLSKPVVYEMLLTRIEKLIEQQEIRKALFHTTIEVTPSSITINSLDEALVQKALLSVENNMDNPQYGVEDLGKDIGLSRGHLYRKLQSITGQNPADFIRSIRLKRAAQLLRDSQLHVTEIADMVGFNTLKYFNKHFKETFGMTPTQYRDEEKI
ncbi:hybrid sensor histidine kinase/response regulator transcription factor [Parapedobacter tibetensis]|uniref:hybrid sensor histidine kinase/response regulator transcription factor n=1 Tax=Parapedobacter tibetensis TaxID=2972951 RepID=UPI00214D8DA9|nr:hybrid sensor histidine kinase/response regulator transcription factor [Parapedobacter tibetensis]